MFVDTAGAAWDFGRAEMFTFGAILKLKRLTIDPSLELLLKSFMAVRKLQAQLTYM